MPAVTWAPWNPVRVKKVDPSTPLERPKPTCVYSQAWPPRKIAPSTTVRTSRKLNQPLRPLRRLTRA